VSASRPSARETASRDYARSRARRRDEARARIHDRVVHPIDVPQLLRDPLVHPASPLRSTVAVTRMVVLAVVAHALTIAFFVLVGQALGRGTFEPRNERVQFEIHELPPRPSAAAAHESLAPTEDAPPAPPTEPKLQPAPPVEPPPQASRPPKRRKRPSPVAPSRETPPTEPTPTEPAAPRKLGGLDMGSTAKTSEGPAFPVGEAGGSPSGSAAAGSSARRASRPGGHQGPPAEGEPEGQRAATRIPTRDRTFVKPKRLAPSKPAYPAALRAQGIEGDVRVRVTVGADGRVTDVVVVRSSGHAAFDETARKAALAETFAPAVRDGKAVSYSISYSYRFRIDE